MCVYVYVYMYICIYVYVNMYMYMYMSRGSYLVQNAIDGVFLPRSPVPSRFGGSDLVLQCCTCF